MSRKVVNCSSKQRLSILSSDSPTLDSQVRAVGKKPAAQSFIYFGEPKKGAISKVAGKIKIPGIAVADHCDCICQCDCSNCLCDCSCSVCDCGSCGSVCSCDCTCDPGYCDCSVCECDCDCIDLEKSRQIYEAAQQIANSLSSAKRVARFGDIGQILSSIRMRSQKKSSSA